MSKVSNILVSLTSDELRELRSRLPVAGHIEYRTVKRKHVDGEIVECGPYKYERRWVNGKLTSKYLGKASADEMERLKGGSHE